VDDPVLDMEADVVVAIDVTEDVVVEIFGSEVVISDDVVVVVVIVVVAVDAELVVDVADDVVGNNTFGRGLSVVVWNLGNLLLFLLLSTRGRLTGAAVVLILI